MRTQTRTSGRSMPCGICPGQGRYQHHTTEQQQQLRWHRIVTDRAMRGRQMATMYTPHSSGNLQYLTYGARFHGSRSLLPLLITPMEAHGSSSRVHGSSIYFHGSSFTSITRPWKPHLLPTEVSLLPWKLHGSRCANPPPNFHATSMEV